MASVDVADCIAAVVSVFHGAADLIETRRKKGDQRSRRRKVKDVEQAAGEKLLHRALVDAARQIHLASVDRAQRFGLAFKTGDDTATSELKDIMISLQTQIVSVLQVEIGVLDSAPLHEAAITNKNSAIRAMCDLCQRIVMAASAQPYLQAETSDTFVRVPRSTSRGHSSDVTHNGILDSARALYVRGSSAHACNVSRTSSLQNSGDSNLQRMLSRSSTPAFLYRHSYERGRNNSSSAACLEEEDDICHSYLSPSLHDSAIGSEPGTRHRPSASITSTVLSDGTICSEDSAESGAKRDELRIVQIPDARAAATAESNTTGYQSDASVPRRLQDTTLDEQYYDNENIEESIRASSAPEVVTKEFESLMLSPISQKSPVSPEYPTDLRTIHPALRQDYHATHIVAPEADQLWSPLNRPDENNKYHNFCKGAWSARQSLQEGLAIAMIPNPKGETVAHWKCKHCEFRSRGLSNITPLPEQVYFSSNGVRYRWLFLAKSHIPATKPHNKPELYGYGCIFCTAQGRTTQIHDTLDKMMEHVVSKHKTDMLTPEVLQKTRCVVGRAVSREEEWDVNLPESVSVGRRMTRDIKEFLVGAVTGILYL